MDAVSQAYYRQQFEYAFLDRNGVAFQDWFADLAGYAFGTDFEMIRPYGKEGDWKCDGRLPHSGTYFQCYAPQNITAEAVINKVDADLSGALAKWGDRVKKWVFVHNDKRGVPPQVADHIDKLRNMHPKIDIEIWVKPQLFELFETMSISAREQLFGPAPSLSALQDLTMPDLQPIVDALEQRDPEPGATMSPPPSVRKLEKNALSEDAATLLRSGRRKVHLVEHYLTNHIYVELGERIAEAFRLRYTKLRTLDLSADQIFGHLQQYAGMNGPPKRQVAALAILAYFFDICDIFEDPEPEDAQS